MNLSLNLDIRSLKLTDQLKWDNLDHLKNSDHITCFCLPNNVFGIKCNENQLNRNLQWCMKIVKIILLLKIMIYFPNQPCYRHNEYYIYLRIMYKWN